MKEQETLITEINIDFKCTKCGNTAQCSILNAITLGAPMCMDCDEEMEQKPIYVKNKPTKKEKLSLYTGDNYYTKTARDLDDEVHKIIRPVFDKYIAMGYNPREVSHAMLSEITNIELMTVLHW